MHNIQTDAPAAEMLPALQLVQLVDALLPVPPKNVPAMQFVQFAEELLPVPVKYVPLGQLVQDGEPATD